MRWHEVDVHGDTGQLRLLCEHRCGFHKASSDGAGIIVKDKSLCPAAFERLRLRNVLLSLRNAVVIARVVKPKKSLPTCPYPSSAADTICGRSTISFIAILTRLS